MNGLDRKIEEALSADEAPLLGPLDEPPLLQQAAEAFRGKFGWMMVMASVATVAGVVFAVVSAIYFFRAQSVQEMIAWASGFGLGLIIAATSRLWGWMTLYKNAVLREVKRVELQLAWLASELRNSR